MLKKTILVIVWIPLLVATFGGSESQAMSLEEKHKLRDKVKEMFHHAYDSYMKYAYPADELMPLSCKGRVRGVDASRGDVDDALGKFSLTLVDTLDTLAVLGEVEEFERAVRLVIRDVQFDNDLVVSVFETNIRMVGGLLGGHVAAVTLKEMGNGMAWYQGELLEMAKDIANRILPAFNTTTGIPYPKVNLKYGIHHPDSGTGSEVDTCTACAGTMIMEFGALSRLTGDPLYEATAGKAMESLWRFRSRASDLVGTVINIHNGDWVRRDSGVGAGIDSYYEYCLKAYILLGDHTYLDRFNKHYKSIMQYINQGAMFLSVQMHQPERTSHAYMDALQAFWPGLQVLKGDLKKAIETHHMLYEVAKKHTFLPEAFTTDFEVHWGEHPLRPELVESTYFLYEATGDPHYLEVGKNIVEKINEHARVPCGFAALKDVRTLTHEDRMDSFVLAETFKYLYLLFSEPQEHIMPMNEFIFTTEAHLLPLSLSTLPANKTAYQQVRYNVTINEENEHEYSCPNTGHSRDRINYAKDIRNNVLFKSQTSCPTKKAFAFTNTKPPRLRAEQFVPGNKDHLDILKSMGITVAQTKEGRIQLMHSAANAQTQSDAEDGIKFMQEMIELAKQRNDESGAATNPRVVQLMSPPYNGSIVLNAGPAQFGLDLSKGDVGVGAEVVIADPFKGCTSLNNEEHIKHRIAIVERGDCMFIDKVRVAEAAGSVAVIIVDNNDGSSSDSQPIFAMAGDGTNNDVKIPAVLLFHQEGMILQRAIQSLKDKGHTLKVRVAAKAAGSAMKKTSSISNSKAPQDKESDVIKESQQKEDIITDDQELDEQIKKLMLELEKHNSVLDKEMTTRLIKTMQSLKKNIHSDDPKNLQQLKSKLITLKNNELLCAATGQPCPKDEILNELNKEMKTSSEIDGSYTVDHSKGTISKTEEAETSNTQTEQKEAQD